MLRIISIFFILFLAIDSKAQYPFDSIKPLQYQYAKTEHKFYASVISRINLGREGRDSFLTLKVEMTDTNWSLFTIRKGSRILYRRKVITHMPYGEAFIRTADINGDGLTDIKMTMYTHGCGLASYYKYHIYLFARQKGGFDWFAFYAFGERAERDFDGDGNYELIALNHEYIKDHAYWIYDIYRYQNGKLVNVSAEFNYPLAIQHLYRPNYKPTDKLSRKQVLDHSERELNWVKVLY